MGNRIDADWERAIADYAAELTAMGQRPTTVRARREHLQHMARRVEVGPWSIDRAGLVGYLGAQTWAQETRRSRCATLAGFFAWALTDGRRADDPAARLARIAPSDPTPRPVPDQVYLAALIQADADEALWIDLAAEHGLRRAEIAGLHSRNIVETLLGHDVVFAGKGGKVRTVPLTRPMARALLERGTGYLFPGDESGHVSARWLGKRVNRLLDDDWTIHKLRHRAASRFWVNAGGDPYAVADLMGWSNLNMVRVYVKHADDRLRSIVEGASLSGAPLVSSPRDAPTRRGAGLASHSRR